MAPGCLMFYSWSAVPLMLMRSTYEQKAAPRRQVSCAERSCGNRAEQHDACRWPRSFDHVVIRVVYKLPSPGPSTECWSAARVHPVQERLHEGRQMGVKAVGLTRAG